VAVTHGEVVVLTDADGEYLYNDAAPYIAAVERGADIVLASRVHPLSSWTCPECVGGYRDSRRRMGRVFNALVRAVVPSRLRDTQTGLKVIGFAVRVCGDGLR